MIEAVGKVDKRKEAGCRVDRGWRMGDRSGTTMGGKNKGWIQVREKADKGLIDRGRVEG